MYENPNIFLKIRKFLLNLVRNVKQFFLPLTIRLQSKSFPRLSGKSDGIVVSLTSFPSRINTLAITLTSIFRQRILPDKIVICLTKDEFPGGISSLPQSLLEFIDYGVDIYFEDSNFNCHNKYYFPLQRFPDATLITIDDDCYYRSDMISRLIQLHKQYPGCVCCNIASIIDVEHFYEYKSWRKSTLSQSPSDLCVALGFAGVLYPPHLSWSKLFDSELFTELAPCADDLWLKANELKDGIKVACGPVYPKPCTVKGSQVVSLRKINKGDSNLNDTQWRRLDEHFNLRQYFE